MFIQTEDTPNSHAIKFFPGIEISESPMHFGSPEDAKSIKIVLSLFGIQGVKSVFLGSDFITITKQEDESWEILKPFIVSSIMDHFSTGFSALEGFSASSSRDYSDSDLSEIEKQIVEIIETRVRPSVAMDGGDIVFQRFEDGVVYVSLRGACSGCPSSTITLKNGIESMLQYYVPEVTAVEAEEGE